MLKLRDEYYFNVKRKRPEDIHEKVTDYFNSKTIDSYASSKNMMRIQEKITSRALELLDLKKQDALILDAGCGCGFASAYLRNSGYKVISLDIISEFLYFYNESDLNPIAADMCFPPFKSNCFDAIISISALQWIFRAINNKPMRINLSNLAKSFERITKPESEIIFQFYPKNDVILKEIGKIFTQNTSLIGNFIIDNPKNPKKRKIFLLLKKKTILK